MSDNGSDDESSGFGDFCGFNLEEDLSEDDLLGDELERPGKTYEYVNFVDPKYAEKRRSKSKSSSHSSNGSILHHSDNEEKDQYEAGQLSPESNLSHSFLNTQISYHSPVNPSATRLISPDPSPNTIPEEEENNPDYYTNHEHDISHDYNHYPLTRINTDSEIAAEHGSVRTSIYLNDGRRQLINYRRNQRRYVWKDADEFDIICVIASPCVKPSNRLIHVPSYGRLLQSQSHTSPRTAVPNTHTEGHSIDINNGVFACVDDEKQTQKRKKHRKHKSNKKSSKTTNKRTKNGIISSEIHAASDGELMRQTSSHSDSSPPQPISRNRSTSSMDEDRDILHHFDIKGLQTFLYDGILCSIHQTARFRTVCGTIDCVRTRISGCKLLHYIGHAVNGKLLLESSNDVGLGAWFDPMTTDTPIVDKMTQCVVIQSPTHLEVADIFLELKVKHVIAIKQQEHDHFAHTRFLTQFYFALIESNTTIARAFRSALNLFEGFQNRDKIIANFKLLPEDEDHELILFRNGLFDVGKPDNYSHKLPPQNNLHAIRPFLGRWNDVYKVMNMIRDKKLSIVCSRNEGCGRTSTIVMATRYLWERGKFEGGVLHIKNNFNTFKIKNMADLILDTLFVSGADGFDGINDLYNEQQDKYSNKSLLAVELLYAYVNRWDDDDDDDEHVTPVCLLFSDFDEMPFPPVAKYSFICALIERFDGEIEENGDIGTRVIITCKKSMLSQLYYFMDHVYGSHNDYFRLPMQYKRGHQTIKPLHEDDLIELFLQMIHIASTETLVYNFHQIKQHKGLQKLFDHQPFKVKQISEYVLQTFDDNLSRQQFQYEEFEEADYGLVYQCENVDSDLDNQSDYDSEEDEEEEQQPRPSFKPYVTSINTITTENQFTSKLELNVDMFSDYNPSPVSTRGSLKHTSTESTPHVPTFTSHRLLGSIHTPQMPEFKSHRLLGSTISVGVSADLSTPYAIRPRRSRSKLVKVISIKTIKLQDSKSGKDRNSLNSPMLPVTPANTPDCVDKNAAEANNRSYANLMADDIRVSVSVEHKQPLSVDLSMDMGLHTIHSTRTASSGDIPNPRQVITGKSYVYMPVTSSHLLAPSLTPSAAPTIHESQPSLQSVQNPTPSFHPTPSKHDVLLESTIVPSDDCHILLSKSTSTNNTLSSRNICVDMAITPMDYKRTFIRQKIDYLIHHKLSKHSSTYSDGFPNIDLPVIMSAAGHKVSFNGQDLSYEHEHHKDVSAKLSRLKLKLTGESIPIAKRHSGGGATPELDEEDEEEEEEDTLDDKIAQAWPTLDDIVSGFTKLQEERKSKQEMDYRKSLVFAHPNGYVHGHVLIDRSPIQPPPPPQQPPQANIAHIPREHHQRRFKNMEAIDEVDRSSPRSTTGTKPLNINVSQPPTNQATTIMLPPLSSMVQQGMSYTTDIDSQLTMSIDQSNPVNIKNARPVIEDTIAQRIWNDNGGNASETNTLGLDDLIMDFYNYLTTKTNNQYLRIDAQSFGPLLKQFDEELQLTAAVFNKVWKWFDSLCDIVNETEKFWNNKFASNHGFITCENAENELLKSAQGTFIVRFTAPSPNVIVTFNDPHKHHLNHPITHMTFVRTNNSDLYTHQNNQKKDPLKVWIQKMDEFRYIYNKDHYTEKAQYFW